MMAKEKSPECLLCKAGYKRPSAPTPVIESMRFGERPVYLCEYHDALLHRPKWATEQEKAEMLRVIGDRLGEDARGRSRRKC